MRMCNDKIAVTIIKTPNKIGSIYVPNQKLTKEAQVKHVNPKYPNLKVGDRIIYDELKGVKLVDPTDGENILVIDYNDIEAKLEQRS